MIIDNDVSINNGTLQVDGSLTLTSTGYLAVGEGNGIEGSTAARLIVAGAFQNDGFVS